MYNRLYLRELQLILQYKDRRSVKRWCENNKISIFSDKGSNRYFVSRLEFEKAFDKHTYPVDGKNNRNLDRKENLEHDFLSILLNS